MSRTRGLPAALAAALLCLAGFAAAGTAASPGQPPAAPAAEGPRSGAWAEAVAAIAAHAHRHGVRFDATGLPATIVGDGLDPSVAALYLRYGQAVGFGQIDPADAAISWDIARGRFDAAAAGAALAAQGLDGALASLPPPHDDYARLVAALARYRAIAARGGWPAVAAGPTLKLGSDGPRVAQLRHRLAVEGDLAAAEVEGSRFDDALYRAVIRYQQRHGLAPDGLVGPKTLAALNAPVAYRIAQIIANMERWRWMPRKLPLPRAEVNVAAGELEVVDRSGGGPAMRVVVGSTRHPTPFLQSEIRGIVLNPPWNVPASIWRNEILPRLRREPGYLAANRMRIIGRAHDPYGLEIDWRRRTEVPAGIRVQQLPGPENALGRVKFDFPNRFDVYLHDTPARALFKRAERALSHGCVRLENAQALVDYLFRAHGPAPRLPSDQGPGPHPTTTVPVPVPLPLFLLYRTAFVGRDGRVNFRRDIYGHDAAMMALLARPAERGPDRLAAQGCRMASSPA